MAGIMTSGIPRFASRIAPFGNRLFHLAHWPGSREREMPGVYGSRVKGAGGAPNEEKGRFRRGREGDESYHRSVLLAEVTHWLEPRPGKLFLDGTLGGGGHSEQLLRAGAKVIGLDQDPAALSFARARLREYEENFGAIQGNFRDFGEILATIGIKGLDGMLFDLGVSGNQFDDGDRGFSFSKDGPLDMRMNPAGDLTAEILVNECDAEELARIFYQYGEERASRRIAQAIVEARERAPLKTTVQLADLVARVVPKKGKIHPATRVFQALRIAVNDELRSLEAVLCEVPRWLRPGGRLVVISFHSLEDRIVKNFMKRTSSPMVDRPEWPEPRPNPDHAFRLVLQKGLAPSAEEVATNPRARSARLRVVERVS